MKKKLSLVVAGLMALTLAPVNSAFAAEENFSAVQIVENNEGSATFRATFKLKDADVKKQEQSESDYWVMMLSLPMLQESLKLK